MNDNRPKGDKPTIWPPFYRADLEAFLKKHDYTREHLTILSWLIWLSLLSRDDLVCVLSRKGQPIDTGHLAHGLSVMRHLGLIDTVIFREPFFGRQHRYYVTDKGLYVYHATVHPLPPLSMTRLVQSYHIERDDLLARLAMPQIHLTCVALVTRIIAEGEAMGHHLMSYQQPWNRWYTFAQKRYLLASDAAFILADQTDTPYACMVHVDMEPHQQAEREVEQHLLSLLDLRQIMLLHRQQWPILLIISTQHRFRLWLHLLEETSIKRATTPLHGGLTSFDLLQSGVYMPIWFNGRTFSIEPDHNTVSLAQLLHEPASAGLIEQFSNQRHTYDIRLKEAAAPPARTKRRLTRYVGESLQTEALHLNRERLTDLFTQTRKSRSSIEAAGLLTLLLTAAEKEIIDWAAHHPLLDILTMQALLRPTSRPQAIQPLQKRITHLFHLGLIEVRQWAEGTTSLERQRYLLTSTALQFMAVRSSEPYSSYMVAPKYHRGDDEQLDRQWGTRGLSGQMGHTHALYTFMRHLYQSTQARGENIYRWKSAHKAARWYRDMVTQEPIYTRPDAELLFFLTPTDRSVNMVLLEYDRGTTGIVEYTRKFTAYLDYQQATGMVLPLLVVTTSQKAAELMQYVLDTLPGSLHIAILLEKEILSRGLSLVILHLSP